MRRGGLVGGRGARLLDTLGRLIGALCVAGSLVVASGCARTAPPIKAPPRVGSAAKLIEEGRRRGLPMASPIELDAGTARWARETLGTFGDPTMRLRRLKNFLTDETTGGFVYTPNLSLTAREALQVRRGDCMAYANVFVSLARAVGLPVYFVHVTEVLSHYEHAGRFFTSSHVAVGYGSGPSSVVFDLTTENRDWKLAVYREIDDAAAVALFYNNVAVDVMTGGRLGPAEALLRYLLEAEPQLEELYNNLGVLLNRRGRFAEALSVLQRGMVVSPSYKPFFTNGLIAARGAGRPELAREIEERGQTIAERNPYFVFARALGFYEAGAYSRAGEEIERATTMSLASPVLYGWLTRARMRAGQIDRGKASFAVVKRLAPESAVVRDLEKEFPELK